MTERDTTYQRMRHEKKVADYYDRANIFYFLMWHGRTFGQHYGFWARGIKNRHEAILAENAELARLAKIKEGDLVLDAGCGVGGSSAWIAKNIGAEVVGINLSEVQLHGAQRVVSEEKNKYMVADKTGFSKADFHRMPFANESFDIVWSLESLEHAVSIDEFIKESFRVLKPGGRIVIAATLKGEIEPSEEQWCQLHVGGDTSGAVVDFQTGDQVRNLMEVAGFEKLRRLDFTEEVLPSAREMTNMCLWGYPVAKAISQLTQHVARIFPEIDKIRKVQMFDKPIGEIIYNVLDASPLITMNNEWGLYQEDLFRADVTRYNVLIGQKPAEIEA